VCRDLVGDRELQVRSTLVVNAAGVWAGQVAATARLHIPLVPSKGAMLAFNHRIVNTLIGRCREPSDADGVIPSHSVLLAGSTDNDICQPDDVSVNPAHIQIILREVDKLVPGISAARKLRAWAGVRPLIKDQQQPVGDTRQITRSHALLDHETLDGKPGLVTIAGGKWTTYRLMAQEAADLVCTRLGVQRECRTHLEALPGDELAHYHWRGAALQHVEEAARAGELVCECELVTRSAVESRVAQTGATTLGDLHRFHRLGMGTCQGGYCGYRAAGILHMLQRPPVRESNTALLDFLQERWRGMVPVLDGQQLRQVRLNELIYVGLLSVDRLSRMQRFE
jgi:glycerol-3-phosphate dehydrogenase